MSDILIRGMEMPKSCFICPFCVPEADEENGEMCVATGRLFGLPSRSERDESCPLVELPPHGDLIDMDKIRYTELYGGVEVTTANWIDSLPVVVPAERREG